MDSQTLRYKHEREVREANARTLDAENDRNKYRSLALSSAL